MLKSFLFFISLILGIALHCYSQNYKWIKQIGDNEGDINPICKILPQGQSVITWYYYDSTKIDNIKAKSQKKEMFIISMLDKRGITKWIWKPDSCINYIVSSDILYSQLLNKIYVCGTFSKGATINKEIYKGNHNGFIIRLDTNGIFEKIYTLTDTSTFLFETLSTNNEQDIIISIQYFKSNSNSKLIIPDLGFSISESGAFFLKLDKDLEPLTVSEPFYGNKIGKLNLVVMSNNQLVTTCTYTDTLKFSTKKYFNGEKTVSTYIAKWDRNLKLKKINVLFTSQAAGYINSLKCIDDGNIVIAGQYKDSISLITKKYKNGSIVPLLACLDSNFQIKWAKIPYIKSGEKIHSNIIDMEIKGDYIYAGGVFEGNSHYDDFHLSDSLGKLWFFKVDKQGNILWMNRCANSIAGQFISSIGANDQKEVLFIGFFVDTLKLNYQIFVTQKNRPDIILIKIHDIDILRGYVYHGPYCAGDTIKIPYTKNGDFNKSNQFIAQLSDEKGNFEGGERELGRITSDTDGVIKGILPMFDVQSSPDYRIRIISTNPVVQSYYKYDTLRLLIYSKDTANAGADTTICNGQSVQLSTTGGSLWRWSPGNMLSDSTARKTIAFPNGTTTYRVIISDSSGCGKTDTAYKTVYVRPPLKILTSDTVLCKDSKTLLKIKPTGGIGKNYSYKWFGATGQELANTDTLRIQASTEGSLKMILGDNCSINDTSQMNITFPVLNFKQIQSKDTLVCTNNSAFLQIKPSSAKQSDYSYRWLDFNGNTLSQNDTMNINITKTDSFKTILTYLCNAKSDTTIMRVLLPQQLITKINKPACFDSSITLSVNATGGYKNILTHVWYRAGKPIDIGKTISLNGIKTKLKITVKSSDYCKTSMKDSLELIPMPKAIIKLTKDTICENDSLTIQNQSTSFTKLVSYLSWESNKTILLNKDTAITLKNTGLQYIKLNITDSIGCTTSDSAKMQVIPKPDASFYITPQNPTVDNGSIELSPKNKDYIEYIWQISNDLIIKHRYWSIVRLPVFDTATYNAILIVKNKYACKDTVSQTIKIAESDAFYIPNAISNNNDGLNDEFAPYGWKVESYQMLIVARTNQVVYKGSTPWKPTIEDGVYSYIIKVKFKDGSQKTFKGLVHVLR
ncbi:MAG: gliding motility-associated C-terminal domain-containing protein [Bacteroidia bacterium]|nr:gliding motility-associated C-terminal domain-containing protein [Bacteroidia bacterium]